ncbi:enoyl-CoA hydratase-related protein, partial [Acidobacteria bacterium AH-259-L09]|nr:enoyl-CoA hydratase-related protein [Acidobacteria bacterium AH-259-L09]
MEHGVKYKIDEKGIAVVEFDLPDKKVNLLSSAVMERLEQIIGELRGRNNVNAVLIVSAKDDVFIAGADVAEIKVIKEAREGEGKAAKGQAILQALNDLKVPVIAAIDGVCLGGGTELSLACHYRIASDSEKTKIGLPEVNLGILPGFGGTQRLPRLIGIQAALDMILSGRPVNARKALRTGLVDKVVPKEKIVQEAQRFVRALLEGTPPSRKKRKDLKSFLLEGNPLGRRILFGQAKQRVFSRTKGHYPAPLKALEVVERGISLPLSEGLALEARFLGELVVTDVCKNLITLFYLNESIKADSG